jgi:hypothetical protein
MLNHGLKSWRVHDLIMAEVRLSVCFHFNERLEELERVAPVQSIVQLVNDPVDTVVLMTSSYCGVNESFTFTSLFTSSSSFSSA